MSYNWQFELECAGRDARNRVMGLLAEDRRKNAAGVREWSKLLRKTMQTIEIQLDRAEADCLGVPAQRFALDSRNDFVSDKNAEAMFLTFEIRRQAPARRASAIFREVLRLTAFLRS